MKLYGRRIGAFFEENANKFIRGFSMWWSDRDRSKNTFLQSKDKEDGSGCLLSEPT